MATRIRTTQRIARGVSIVSYQKPQDYLVGIVILCIIVLFVLHSIFGEWLGWVITGFIVLNWLSAITRGGSFAKTFWSAALLVAAVTVWTSEGCPGNAAFCTKMDADIKAKEKQDAINRATQRIEDCATLAYSDWRTDPDCRIYTEQEIATARAKHEAKEFEENARRSAEAQKEESERRARIQHDIDVLRQAR